MRHVRYKGVELTPAGERVALEVMRHHRLLETYLAEHLGVPWDRVHEEAEALEHVLSETWRRGSRPSSATRRTIRTAIRSQRLAEYPIEGDVHRFDSSRATVASFVSVSDSEGCCAISASAEWGSASGSRYSSGHRSVAR